MFAERGHAHPRTAAGALVTMPLGSALFQGAANVALGRPSDDERLIQFLDRTRGAVTEAETF